MTASEAPLAGVRVDRRVSPVLVGCEESQTITKALRAAGHEAYSCDLAPTRGNPAWHYQQDICEVIPTRRWGLIILHPDCTAMAVSGNRWYGRGMPMHHKREQAIAWTVGLWELAKQYGDKVALENPVSVIFQHLNAPVCYVQPYEHGHGETKKTGFALHNLEPLKPTNEVEGREQRIWKMPPSPTRKRDRSQTFDGIAQAVVMQWANVQIEARPASGASLSNAGLENKGEAMEYQPELGQMCFGQPWQQKECPEKVLSALRALQNTFEAVRDDINPFGNNGTRFDGEKFKAHAYSWSDDDQEFNFAWRDVRVSWCKYLGRGTTINRAMDDAEVTQMLRECMAELLSNVVVQGAEAALSPKAPSGT